MQLLQAQANQLNDRLTKLEADQQAGQDAIGSFADKLVKENANLDNRLMELQIMTGTHMHTIEETFMRAAKAMEELTAAGKAASTAAAHAMASSAGAASGGGTSPGLSRTDLSILRVQIGSQAAEQLAHAEAISGLDTCISAHLLVSFPDRSRKKTKHPAVRN